MQTAVKGGIYFLHAHSGMGRQRVRRSGTHGSLCWMRRRIWRFSSVIFMSSRLRYSLFRLFPNLHAHRAPARCDNQTRRKLHTTHTKNSQVQLPTLNNCSHASSCRRRRRSRSRQHRALPFTFLPHTSPARRRRCQRRLSWGSGEYARYRRTHVLFVEQLRVGHDVGHLIE
jgi:hypothetical protein